jgi:hypothetical protein
MIFLSKYQENQPAEPVKIKKSPFRNLDRTCNLLKKYLQEKNQLKRKLIFGNLWFENGE